VVLWGLVPFATIPIGWLAARALAGAELAWEQSVRGRYAEVLLWTYVVMAQLLLGPFYLRQLA